MNPSDESKELKPNWVDYSVAGTRGGLNLVPIVGPIFAEIIGTTIPNQRIDRISKFAIELERKIDEMAEKPTDSQLNNPQFTDVLEEGFRQAAHSLSDERRRYIARLVVGGLSSEDIDLAASRHLLRILDELSDVEVIWLRSYKHPTIGGDEEFRQTHEAVLTPVRAGLGSSQELMYRSALQENYKDHLAQLGLLARRFRTDMQTRMPKFDRYSGQTEVSGYTITRLGRILLREIGLDTDE